ncbi:hypothetical protein EVAR_85827_1 [Eumeta japonica]|uniref:Uncharacterized protein n=1 Tax=Eumeta variegata TaxID=151549 RepID=A0A4C1UQA8_EUMVA|nr:hypothetical protein EVAR_85827_1 [Eumeta japonica]
MERGRINAGPSPLTLEGADLTSYSTIGTSGLGWYPNLNLCIFTAYNVEQLESSESSKLFDLMSAANFRHHSDRRKHHQHRLDGWRSTTVVFMSNFLSRTTGLWNNLPSAEFPINFDNWIFKEKKHSFSKGRQHTNDFSGVAVVYGRR